MEPAQPVQSLGAPVQHPSFAGAFRFWLRLGFISFGGPAGQIAIMQTELVEKRRWIGQARFLHALNFCMLLPARKRRSWRSTSGGFCIERPGDRGGSAFRPAFDGASLDAQFRLRGLWRGPMD